MIELTQKDVSKIVSITNHYIDISVVLNNLYVHYLDYDDFKYFLYMLKFNNITGKNIWYLFNVVCKDDYNEFIECVDTIHNINFN